jgi:hypothetical protein
MDRIWHRQDRTCLESPDASLGADTHVALELESLRSPVTKSLNSTRSEKIVTKRGSSALAEVEANPQGKGQLGFLLDWAYSSPRGVVAKRAPQLLADYFTSLLVLSAAFKFKPVFGKDYYLYRESDTWSLSLVSPDEWNTDAKWAAFVGKCVLHADSTWSIEPSDNIGKHDIVDDALATFYDGFVDKLQSQEPLDDKLPVYEAGLPYYQRLFAAALSKSIKGSLALGDQLGRKSESWLTTLPKDASRLFLAHDG